MFCLSQSLLNTSFLTYCCSSIIFSLKPPPTTNLLFSYLCNDRSGCGFALFEESVPGLTNDTGFGSYQTGRGIFHWEECCLQNLHTVKLTRRKQKRFTLAECTQMSHESYFNHSPHLPWGTMAV